MEQQNDGHFRFQVPKSKRPFEIFELLEKAKQTLCVLSEYSVSHTSLEHIFNSMAAQQEEEQFLQ